MSLSSGRPCLVVLGRMNDSGECCRIAQSAPSSIEICFTNSTSKPIDPVIVSKHSVPGSGEPRRHPNPYFAASGGTTDAAKRRMIACSGPTLWIDFGRSSRSSKRPIVVCVGRPSFGLTRVAYSLIVRSNGPHFFSVRQTKTCPEVGSNGIP